MRSTWNFICAGTNSIFCIFRTADPFPLKQTWLRTCPCCMERYRRLAAECLDAANYLSRDDHRDAVLRWPKSGSDWPTNTTRPRRRSHNQRRHNPPCSNNSKSSPTTKRRSRDKLFSTWPECNLILKRAAARTLSKGCVTAWQGRAPKFFEGLAQSWSLFRAARSCRRSSPAPLKRANGLGHG
jgi:hypothetical protein